MIEGETYDESSDEEEKAERQKQELFKKELEVLTEKADNPYAEEAKIASPVAPTEEKAIKVEAVKPSLSMKELIVKGVRLEIEQVDDLHLNLVSAKKDVKNISLVRNLVST